MNRCPRCVAAYGETGRPEHFGSDPRCGFPTREALDPDNWNCMTMNALRQLTEDAMDNEEMKGLAYIMWHDDYHAALLRAADCEFLVMVWYKRRGCTDQAWIVNDDHVRPLTWAEAEMILQREEKRGNIEPLSPAMGNIPCCKCGSNDIKYAAPKDGNTQADLSDPTKWDPYCLKCAPPEIVAAGEAVLAEFEQEIQSAMEVALRGAISQEMAREKAQAEEDLIAPAIHIGDIKAFEVRVREVLEPFEGERNTAETREAITNAVLEVLADLFERDPNAE